MEISTPDFYEYRRYIEILSEKDNYKGDKRRKEYHELKRNIVKFEYEYREISWYYIYKYSIKYYLEYYFEMQLKHQTHNG